VRILVIGAGKSTAMLIDYLLGQAAERDWRVHVVDLDVDLARSRVGDHPCGTAGELDADDAEARDSLIRDANLVVSMLPANMHGPVAESCVEHGTHFVSASYVSTEVHDLHQSAEQAEVTILNEVGVDPGIDHMSAMERLDGLRERGAKIQAFETFTGGLVAPDFDDNPWRYKFTWNPRNVVLAGQGGVKFKHHGRFKYIPYHRLFKRYERLQIPGYGEFEAYPNRDSLKYRHSYGLRGIDTIYRGTLRRPGFCDAWDCLVQLGLTDDSESIERLAGMTFRDLVNAFLWYDAAMSVELKVRAYLKLDLNAPEFDKLQWLGLFEPIPIDLSRGTPAQALQKRLEAKWALQPEDRDMIAMLHKIEYELEGKTFREESSMVTLGSDSVRTAMAKTVGLTAGIAAKLILVGGIQARGVLIPTTREVYAPILAELREFDICFEDSVEEIG
jgi:saccharopine dehydrogenase (NADP+, L-glutamate forming)